MKSNNVELAKNPACIFKILNWPVIRWTTKLEIDVSFAAIHEARRHVSGNKREIDSSIDIVVRDISLRLECLSCN